jgi:hypothetical protein
VLSLRINGAFVAGTAKTLTFLNFTVDWLGTCPTVSNIMVGEGTQKKTYSIYNTAKV